MVIEIDDSGWGDLIGGVVIVLRRMETDEHYSDEIPSELFKQDEFKYKIYLRYATQVILEGLDSLDVSKSEEIHICKGYIFDQAKDILRELGYRIFEKKIIGKTQTFAEKAFIESLVKQSIGTFKEIAEMRSFNGFLTWVKCDLENRERHVKTGWKNWLKHREE
jgi:hypothetical protein